MMPQSKKTRRTEITIETARVIVISKPTRIFGWCAECNKEVDWVAVDEVALLAGASSRGVFRMVEAGELHSTETREGILLVCTGSLVTATSSQQMLRRAGLKAWGETERKTS